MWQETQNQRRLLVLGLQMRLGQGWPSSLVHVDFSIPLHRLLQGKGLRHNDHVKLAAAPLLIMTALAA